VLFGWARKKAGKRIIWIVKVATLMMALDLILLIFVMQESGQEALFAIGYATFGFFSVG
jgi:hypothetical protein